MVQQERGRARELELADAYEAQHPELADARADIRADDQLSILAKTVLLLTMQIPEGRWTTYRAMQEYTSERRGMCSVRQVGQCLKKSTLPKEVAPCHRGLEQWSITPGQTSLGPHNDDLVWTSDVLRREGVRFSGIGTIIEKPMGSAFREFVGLPRL